MWEKMTPWTRTRSAPVVRQEELHRYVLAAPSLVHRCTCITMGMHPIEKWWSFVREELWPEYCLIRGPHDLPTKVMLRTARELKYWFDRQVADQADYDQQINLEPVR